MNDTFELSNGPQDGAKVKAVGGSIPQEIFVGPTCKGDGYAAWSSEQCDRFPILYIIDGNVYRHCPNHRTEDV